MTDTPDLETKAATVANPPAFEAFMREFEEFRDTNDRRLAEIERRGAADPVTADKLAKLDRAVDELTHRQSRPGLSMPQQASTAQALHHKSAFDGYVRRGESASLRGLETKALSTDGDGGYLVPADTEAAVNAALRDVSPIRAIAGVIQVSSSVYKKPFATSGASSGWVAAAAPRPQTDSPALTELAFPTMELYAMPAATQALLDDSAVNIDQWIADEVRSAFAQQEGTAFVTGDGVSKPKGILAYDQVANASWVHGKLGVIGTGVSGGFPAANAADKLLDLIYTLKSGYRANATFLMNRATQAAVRKLKDGDGRYLWQPSGAPGEAPTLMGFPIAESEDMPDIGAGTTPIAVGDFRRGYLIVDRVGIRVLRDPYSAKPYVLFYTTKRVGGGIQDFEAIKLLKFA
jgi:HK97 family phage major capsid protein